MTGTQALTRVSRNAEAKQTESQAWVDLGEGLTSDGPCGRRSILRRDRMMFVGDDPPAADFPQPDGQAEIEAFRLAPSPGSAQPNVATAKATSLPAVIASSWISNGIASLVQE